MVESIEKFSKLVADTEQYLNATVSEEVQSVFQAALKNAKRVYITGTGTSLPNALLLEELINQSTDTPARFLSTGKMIREIPRLKSDDLVILISHGMNRADSLIIWENAKKRAKTIVITGNKGLEIDSGALKIIVPPEKEKIFCRPISPITTFRAICQLFNLELPKYNPGRHRISEITRQIDPAKQQILLYSAGVSYAANLWGIVLREGAGLNVLTKDLENYSHGYYGVDTANLDSRQFIILTSENSADKRDYGRAARLYELPRLEKFTRLIETGDNSIAANYQLFCEAPFFVENMIRRTGYDMDNPLGKEENRRYHEFDHFRNYI